MFKSAAIQYIKDKWVLALVSALLLTGVMGNYTISTPQDGTTPVNSMTAWELRTVQIDTMMHGIIANPTENNVGAAYWDLKDMGDWSYDNPGPQTAAFEAYLEACNDVRLSLKRGDSQETVNQYIVTMNEKKNLI